MANQTTGLRRLCHAMGYTVKGLSAAWRHEAAFRQEAVAVIIAIIIACYLEISVFSRILLIGSVWLVVIVELINSAIEAVVDRIGSELHPLSGRAKDIGSAAVFLTIAQALCVWVAVLWHHYR